MIPNWTNHLKDPEEKKRFRSYIMNSRGVLERLGELMKQKETELNQVETSPTTYDSPSWAALQAHRNGYRECLNYITKLITLDQKDTHDNL